MDNNKLYVARAFCKNNILSNINDILNDITIPFGLSSFSERYRDISDILDENHNISEVISHSLGASASSKYLQNNPNRNIRLTTYGARYIIFRSGGDVMSILDQGSIQTRTNTYSPLTNHQYTNFQDQGKEPTVGGDPVRLIM